MRLYYFLLRKLKNVHIKEKSSISNSLQTFIMSKIKNNEHIFETQIPAYIIIRINWHSHNMYDQVIQTKKN